MVKIENGKKIPMLSNANRFQIKLGSGTQQIRNLSSTRAQTFTCDWSKLVIG